MGINCAVSTGWPADQSQVGVDPTDQQLAGRPDMGRVRDEAGVSQVDQQALLGIQWFVLVVQVEELGVELSDAAGTGEAALQRQQGPVRPQDHVTSRHRLREVNAGPETNLEL